MKTLVENFSKQLSEAILIGGQAKLSRSQNEIRNVVISGLGGSGIGGTIAAEITSGTSPVPVIVTKDYFLPEFVNENTLVIISSYSGNTEETLSAFRIALHKKAKIVCVSSGGTIVEEARKNSLDHIIIPPGMPPRACLGYSLTQLFFILSFFGIINDDFKKQIAA